MHAAADQAAGCLVARHGQLDEQRGKLHFGDLAAIDLLVDQQ